MNSLAALLASFALVLPAGIAGSDGARVADAAHAAPEHSAEGSRLPVSGEQSYAPLLYRYQPDARNQVRIEQRVIIRVSPARIRQELLADLPQGEVATRFREQPMKRCVAMANIAGVQSGSQNRLILFLRDRRIVSAALEKTCSARDFYSGFYVERTQDGLFCSGRDTLLSRTGASCGVSRFANLVAVKD